MNVVVGLFSHIGIVRLHIKLVATAAKLVSAVVFEREFREVGGAKEAAESERLGLELGNLGVAVIIVVVTLANAVLTIDKDAHFIVFAHSGSAERGVVVESRRNAHRS